MRKLIVLLIVVAMAMTGLFATDINITLSPKGIESDSFMAKIVEGALTAYPSSVNEKTEYSSTLDAENDVQIAFTVLWDMISNTASPKCNLTIQAAKPSNNNSSSDVLDMTATASAFYPAAATPKEGAIPSVNVGSDSADTIVSFASDSVSVVKSQGGVAVTLTIPSSSMEKATAGATYTSTVTVTASTK